jgi:FixJ family two-component response regulator
MDQPALDQWLGTVGADPPCCFRTATHLHNKYSRKHPRQAASTDFLNKPFTATELDAAIQEVFARRAEELKSA